MYYDSYPEITVGGETLKLVWVVKTCIVKMAEKYFSSLNPFSIFILLEQQYKYSAFQISIYTIWNVYFTEEV